MIRKRMSLTVRGIVQGVGFRPFLHRLAVSCHLTGWVRNTSGGVEAELEGEEEALWEFQRRLRAEAPPLSMLEEITTDFLPNLRNYEAFEIRESGTMEDSTLVSPDISICPDCERELGTPSDRRYRYPFINCTSCGPRYTIVKQLPYDRAQTSMRGFSMCGDCFAEYGDIRDRRYHAQPDCCPDCGPQMYYLDRAGQRMAGAGNDLSEDRECPAEGHAGGGDPFEFAQKELACGGIVAVKGIGGIHLACDGENEKAVERLRRRKHRPAKPLALLCRSMEEVLRIAEPTETEKELLLSARRPIVLVKKRKALDYLAKGPRIGIMLPYTPIHLLLSDGSFGGPKVLVMTSANRPGCPVLVRENEALEVLSEIADGYLFHNRPIENRCDDSVLMEWNHGAYFFRRSRGYAPQPLYSKEDVTGIYAFGAEQKGSFALGKGNHIFLSPHIGDLKHLETADHYRGAMETYERLFQTRPRFLVCDLHPDYVSAREARKLWERETLREQGGLREQLTEPAARLPEIPLLKVQHHWAHMASCMEDSGLTEPVFGIIWDGTGLGTDGTIWGGEFLEGDFRGFTRVGSIRPAALPGGDKAVKEIGRTALSLLLDAGISLNEILSSDAVPLPKTKKRALAALLGSELAKNACPKASSIGRLFDGVCSMLFEKAESSYDGEGGMLLESSSEKEVPGFGGEPSAPPYPVHFYEQEYDDAEGKHSVRVFDTRPMIRAVWEELAAAKKPDWGAEDRSAEGPGISCQARISRKFMETLCHMAAEQCRALNRKKLPVVLSGGVFQNRFLLSGVTELLEQDGFTVYCHRRVSPGDEGISLGQLAIGREQMKSQGRKKEDVSCASNEDKNN